MKRIIIFLCLSFFIFYGCTGPAGEMGPMGPGGATGPGGDPGGTTEYIIINTIWNTDKYLNHNVFIDSGVTLTINPGVNIYMYPDNNIYNYGKIIANGNIANWITIKFQLNFLYNCELISYDGSTNIFSFCKFESLQNINIQGGCLDLNNCIIQKGFYYGVVIGSFSTLKICNSDIISNNFYGIESDPGGTTYLSNNYIAYNMGSLIVALSTLVNDPDIPIQYRGLSQPRIAPRATPNFP